MQYYNIHSHIFTMNNAPRRFLHLYLPDPVADAIDKITNTKFGAWLVEKLLSNFGGNGGKRYASFLQIGKSKNQLEVFEDLMKQYNDDETMRFIALTMYMEKCGADVSASGYEGQIEEILAVKKQYPDRLMIFLGIDPRWKLTGPELRKTVEAYFEKKLEINAGRSVYPFTGLKVYPSTGFYSFDERLKETFEWAADNGVPVLSHCSYLGGIYSNDSGYIKGNLNPFDPYTGLYYTKPVYIKSKVSGIFSNKDATSNKNTCSYFMEPASYESLLEYFHSRTGNPLKLCLAHFGGGNQISATVSSNLSKEEKDPYGVKNRNWFLQVQDLLKAYKGLYTDISYALWDKEIHPILLAQLNDPEYGGRILFGTDFFLTEREQPERETYNNFKTAAIEKTLSNYNNIRAWDQIAGKNIATFLQSKYC